MSWTDELDPHFARAWSAYTGGLAARHILTDRVRLLVGIGECTMIGEPDGGDSPGRGGAGGRRVDRRDP